MLIASALNGSSPPPSVSDNPRYRAAFAAKKHQFSGSDYCPPPPSEPPDNLLCFIVCQMVHYKVVIVLLVYVECQ